MLSILIRARKRKKRDEEGMIEKCVVVVYIQCYPGITDSKKPQYPSSPPQVVGDMDDVGVTHYWLDVVAIRPYQFVAEWDIIRFRMQLTLLLLALPL